MIVGALGLFHHKEKERNNKDKWNEAKHHVSPKIRILSIGDFCFDLVFDFRINVYQNFIDGGTGFFNGEIFKQFCVVFHGIIDAIAYHFDSFDFTGFDLIYKSTEWFFFAFGGGRIEEKVQACQNKSGNQQIQKVVLWLGWKLFSLRWGWIFV